MSVLTPIVLSSWAPAFAGGGNSNDTLSTSNESHNEGVVVARLNISIADINPDYAKVARWDTSDLNMYHVDMTRFRDTLVYRFDGEEGSLDYTVPHPGMVTSGFGHRHLFGRRFHKGIDIDLETGDQVSAAITGKVRIAHYNRGYGNCVVIAHEGGLETLYGHLSEIYVTEGQIVKSGEVIGLGGSTGQSTGPHLHFEMRIFGEQIDPSRVLDLHTLMPKDKEVRIDMSWFDHLLTEEDEFHIVAPGETLDQICTMYEMDKAWLCHINNIKPEDALPEGTRLLLGE